MHISGKVFEPYHHLKDENQQETPKDLRTTPSLAARMNTKERDSHAKEF